MKRFLVTALWTQAPLAAQCVMCFRTASGQQIERARILNAGIFVLLVPALGAAAGFGFLLWRRFRREAQSANRL